MRGESIEKYFEDVKKGAKWWLDGVQMIEEFI